MIQAEAQPVYAWESVLEDCMWRHTRVECGNFCLCTSVCDIRNAYTAVFAEVIDRNLCWGTRKAGTVTVGDVAAGLQTADVSRMFWPVPFAGGCVQLGV